MARRKKKKKSSRVMLIWISVILTWTVCLFIACVIVINQDCYLDTCQIDQDLINVSEYGADLDTEPYEEYNESSLEEWTPSDPGFVRRSSIVLLWGADGMNRNVTCGQCLCHITSDTTLTADADAVVLNAEYLSGSDDLPRLKPNSQRWILVIQVPPAKLKKSLSFLDDLIDWTSSYVIGVNGSDIPLQYGHYHKWQRSNETLHIPSTIKADSLVTHRHRLAAWFVSECRPPPTLMRLVHQLQQSINVDVYGPCMDLNCGDRQRCTQMLKEHYKFYFAFENANCRHYITNEFWHVALLHDVIPVVMGAPREDYERVAPPRSFIHVNDFTSVTKLARYINRVNNVEILYKSYFKWKQTGFVVVSDPWPSLDNSYWCDVCRTLQETQNNITEYTDLTSWWHRSNQCKPF